MWGNGEQLAKPLANGDVAVLLFNRLATPIDIVCEYYLGCVLPPLPRRVRVQLCTFWVWARMCVWRLLSKHRPVTAVIQVLNFEDIGNTSLRCWNVRDIWAGEDVGRQNLTFTATAVPPHGCRFLRLSKGEICAAAPPPPPAVCPSGYTQHTGGYWQNTGTMAL
jgi:hypothetical protein